MEGRLLPGALSHWFAAGCALRSLQPAPLRGPTGRAPAELFDMSSDVLSPASLVDLVRYPVEDLSSDVASGVVDVARAQLAATGAAELPGFVTPAGVAALVADAEALAGRAFHSTGIGTAYLEIPDFDLPDDHPRRWLG